MLSFEKFLNENSTNRVEWKDMEFESSAEKAVCDVSEETLVGADLIVICEGDSLFTKLNQIISSGEGKLVLEISGVRLYHYTTPFEFLKWDTIGASPKDLIDTCFILSQKDLKKV